MPSLSAAAVWERLASTQEVTEAQKTGENTETLAGKQNLEAVEKQQKREENPENEDADTAHRKGGALWQ